jgi:hypothetical protein
MAGQRKLNKPIAAIAAAVAVFVIWAVHDGSGSSTSSPTLVVATTAATYDLPTDDLSPSDASTTDPALTPTDDSPTDLPTVPADTGYAPASPPPAAPIRLAAQPTEAPPAPPPNAPPAGATALCDDGTYSYSQHHQGTCSHHGGVAQWL